MNTKTIDLIVLEGEQNKRIPFIEFTLDQLPTKSTYISPTPEKAELLKGAGDQYTVQSLIKTYLDGIARIYYLFKKITTGTDLEKRITFEHITARPFAYALPGAYQKVKPIVPKEKEQDAEVIPGAHLSWGEGIFSSLNQYSSLDYLLGSNVHEHTHHMHYLLYPDQYTASDATMIETMAIFTEMKCNCPINYLPPDYDPTSGTGDTPHYRAERLLRQLEIDEKYSKMDLAAQWNYLINFIKHEELSKHINSLP